MEVSNINRRITNGFLNLRLDYVIYPTKYLLDFVTRFEDS
jgi:hypothetical protein